MRVCVFVLVCLLLLIFQRLNMAELLVDSSQAYLRKVFSKVK